MKYKELCKAADADRKKQKLVSKLLTKNSTKADHMQLLAKPMAELVNLAEKSAK